MTRQVELKTENKIARIILNNPNKHNAFNEVIIDDFLDILNKLKNDTTIKVIILEAVGKSFCAGADLEWMQKMVNFTREENYNDSLKLAEVFHLLYNLPQVTIAKIQGAAYGGGVGLVACCDIAIASGNANFCFSEVKLGLMPAVISPYVLKAIGLKQAKRYFVTAEIISSKKALDINLVNEIVNENELENFVDDMAQNIMMNCGYAIRRAKKLLNNIANKEIDQNLIELTANEISNLRVSEKAQARLKKFLVK
tara:strand:- start:19735 stop:20496 length:762 start_codon:yes stop_codon:yes gene_type:complete